MAGGVWVWALLWTSLCSGHTFSREMRVLAPDLDLPTAGKGTHKADLPATTIGSGDMETLKHLISSIRTSVVQIVCSSINFDWSKPWDLGSSEESSGSGFFVNIRGQGFILTNGHVVEDSVSIHVSVPGLGEEIFQAGIYAVAYDKDVALLTLQPESRKALQRLLTKHNEAIHYLPLADSDTFTQGSMAVAVGYPLGQANLKFSTGILSGKEHVDARFFLQITSPINPGNSGGPLLDAHGRVMGINTAAIAKASNVGYAIPIRHIIKLLESFVPLPNATQHGATSSLEQVSEGASVGVGLGAGDIAGVVGNGVGDTGAGTADAALPAGFEQKRREKGVASAPITLDPSQLASLPAPSLASSSSSSQLLAGSSASIGKRSGDANGDQYSSPDDISPLSALSAMSTHGYDGTPALDATVIRHFPLLGVDMVPSTPELLKLMGYDGDGGCYVARVHPIGLFKRAGVQPGDLLLEYDQHSLDRFGHSSAGPLMEQMNVYDLSERVTIGADVKLKIWRQKASIELQAPFEACKTHYAIEMIKDPFRQGVSFDVFGGLVLMQLSLNHVRLLMLEKNLALASFLEPETLTEPKLILSCILGQSPVPDGVVQVGDIITKVNGIKVDSLASYQKAFMPHGPFWTLETHNGAMVVLPFDEVLAQEKRIAVFNGYQVTRTVQKALQHRAAPTPIPLVPPVPSIPPIPTPPPNATLLPLPVEAPPTPGVEFGPAQPSSSNHVLQTVPVLPAVPKNDVLPAVPKNDVLPAVRSNPARHQQ